MRLIVASLFLLISILGQAQDIFGSDKMAFALMPSEIVASGPTKDIEISWSGRIIVYRRQQISSVTDFLLEKNPPTYSWYSFDRTTKATQRLAIPNDASYVNILGDDENVYFTNTTNQITGFYNLKLGRIIPLSIDKSWSAVNYGEQPYCPFLAYRQSSTETILLFPNGAKQVFTVALGLNVSYPIGSDAQNLYFFATTTKAGAKEDGQLTVNRLTGMTTFKVLSEDEKDKLLEIVVPSIQDFDVIDEGNANYISLEDIEEPNKTAIPQKAKVGPSGDYHFDQKNSFVLYEDAGSLLLREIKSISMDLALKACDNGLRKKLIAEARHVGVALLICSADNDDSMPTQENWEEMVFPYAKDRELLKRFTYVFKGGPTEGIKNEDTVELGFILGPGGRAVVYLDGSAKWIPNP